MITLMQLTLIFLLNAFAISIESTQSYIITNKDTLSIADQVKIETKITLTKSIAQNNLQSFYLQPVTDSRWLTIGAYTIDRNSLSISQSNDSKTIFIRLSAVITDTNNKPNQTITFTYEPESLNIVSPLNIGTINDPKPAQAKQSLPPVAYGEKNNIAIFFLFIISITLVISIFYYLFRFIKKRKGNIGKQQTAYQAASAELKRLKKEYTKKKNLSLNEWKSFSTQLIQIFKKYIEKELGYSAHEFTDSEMIKFFKQNSILVKFNNLEQVLGESSEVRYGKKALNINIITEHCSLVSDFIESNRKILKK